MPKEIPAEDGTFMRVTVAFGPWLDESPGARELVIEVENGTCVGELLRFLADRYGGVFRDAIPKPGEHPGILILRNRRVVLNMGEELSDGDEIGFAIPMSGG